MKGQFKAQTEHVLDSELLEAGTWLSLTQPGTAGLLQHASVCAEFGD